MWKRGRDAAEWAASGRGMGAEKFSRGKEPEGFATAELEQPGQDGTEAWSEGLLRGLKKQKEVGRMGECWEAEKVAPAACVLG